MYVIKYCNDCYIMFIQKSYSVLYDRYMFNCISNVDSILMYILRIQESF